MADYRIVDVSTILSKWHDLLKDRWPNFPCQTFTMFMHNNSQELVRCRECKHSRPLTQEGYVACILWSRAFHLDGFCYMGEKMDEPSP